ncbi:hypothetical protein ACFPOI_34190 [Nonomuraea angiospora]|uniref:DUF3817 domain-containing protein n=1 Tax=Nonomuraea angiospora TaxID=46172 RepID=A0ABR9LTB5_9ACTN|nr:hypothetical protein [Nonomuraea angiospora]MBE1583894.1 hypothetical protein [Nonomuraea angiospora]
MRLLRIAAAVEAASLVVLLGNLFTVHAKVITTFCGPLHGTAYLAVIAAAWTARPAGRWLAFVPGVGGLLVLRAPRARAGG